MYVLWSFHSICYSYRFNVITIGANLLHAEYCKTGYFRGHVIFAVFAVDIQSTKINDRGSKKTHPGPNTTLSLLH